jgi:hypothetical protein
MLVQEPKDYYEVSKGKGKEKQTRTTSKGGKLAPFIQQAFR